MSGGGWLKSAIMALGLCLASGVAAQEGDGGVRGQGWSAVSARSIGDGQTALIGQLGWPGLSFGLLHGASPRVDVGGKLSLNYGFEGIVTQVVPGLKLQGLLRLEMLRRQRLSLGLTFAPGPFFYFFPFGFTLAGVTLPVGVTFGFAVGSAVMLHGAVDLPLFVTFGSFGGLFIPLLVGGGLEYFVDRSLSLQFTTRMGPSIDTRPVLFRRRAADFAFQAQIGIAYRFR